MHPTTKLYRAIGFAISTVPDVLAINPARGNRSTTAPTLSLPTAGLRRPARRRIVSPEQGENLGVG
jgi:hypothetical protein